MSRILRRGAAWRWLIIAVLVAAMVLPFMPTAAFAASESSDVAAAGTDVSWYGYTCSSYYRVQPGDHLLNIARWYGVSLHNISAANGITNPSLIYVGQSLCIPSGHSGSHGSHGHSGGCWYTVQSGDNLSRIAKWYGIPWPHMARANHLHSPWIVVPGQSLYVCW